MFNPQMLVLAREARGKTQSELARMLFTTQGRISKLEAGLLEITDEELDKVATTLGLPKHFFYQSERVYGYGSTCIYHRKRQSLPVNVLRRLLAEINIQRIEVAKLLEGAEIEVPNKFYRLDVGDYDGSGPEHIARLVRGYWGFRQGPINNLTNAIEMAGGIVVRAAFGTSKIDAMSQWPVGQPPLFFVNSEIPTDRARFTLAHEIGHVIMHQIPTRDMEREADRFASEFLMPAQEIKPYLDSLSLARLAALKPHWKVSMAALLKRAEDLRKVTPRRKAYLWTQMGKQGYRKDEPVELPPEIPSVLPDVIELYQNTYGYSISQISHLVATNETEFRTKYLTAPPSPQSLSLVG